MRLLGGSLGPRRGDFERDHTANERKVRDILGDERCAQLANRGGEEQIVPEAALPEAAGIGTEHAQGHVQCGRLLPSVERRRMQPTPGLKRLNQALVKSPPPIRRGRTDQELVDDDRTQDDPGELGLMERLKLRVTVRAQEGPDVDVGVKNDHRSARQGREVILKSSLADEAGEADVQLDSELGEVRDGVQGTRDGLGLCLGAE